VTLFACTTGPVSEPQASASQSAAPASPEETFDPGHVSQELYETTKADVQKLIDDLNDIIRDKDYTAWAAYLDGGYFADISSAENLRRLSDSPALKSQKIVLRSPQDYFNHVVVPSRSSSRVSDRVDDVEFIDQNRVKAYTVTEKGDRVRLYDLEKTAEGWKILN
jgi:hypothetical protein